MGGPAQVDLVRAVLQAMPDLELWLDAGLLTRLRPMHCASASASTRSAWLLCSAASRCVRAPALQRCFAGLTGRDAVLSLDRRDGRRLDEAGCWEQPALWPRRVIVMTLERVGADAGPDLETLREVRSLSPLTQLVGAGGIRNPADLARASDAGAHAWLVASALHDGRLPPVPR